MEQTTQDASNPSLQELFNYTSALFASTPKRQEKMTGVLADYLLENVGYRDFHSYFMEMGRKTLKSLLDKIEAEFSTGEKAIAVFNAYYDVARYQTDPQDAATEWGAELPVLQELLQLRPAPETPAERHELEVPSDVKAKREPKK